MKVTTTGSNLFAYLDRLWLKWDKLVGVKTGGCPSLTGENVGFSKQILNKVTKKNQNWNYFWIAVNTVVCCISQIWKLAMLLMFKLKLGDKDKKSPSKLTCTWFRTAWSRFSKAERISVFSTQTWNWSHTRRVCFAFRSSMIHKPAVWGQIRIILKYDGVWSFRTVRTRILKFWISLGANEEELIWEKYDFSLSGQWSRPDTLCVGLTAPILYISYHVHCYRVSNNIKTNKSPKCEITHTSKTVVDKQPKKKHHCCDTFWLHCIISIR